MKSSQFLARWFLVAILALITGVRPGWAQTDRVAPTVTFVEPVPTAVVNSLPTVRGTVVDEEGGSGVQRVTLAIFRVVDQQWWNGVAWTPRFLELPTVLNGNTWERNTGLPSGTELIDGQHVLVALGYDVANNRREQDNTITVDKTAPTLLRFTKPADGQLINRFTSIVGNVQDNEGGSGISKVDLFIRRSSDGLYWSGSAWVSTPTPLATRSGGGFFTRDTDLPNGADLPTDTYLLTANADDNAGNRTTASSTVRVIADNTAPTFTVLVPVNNSVVRTLTRVAGNVQDNAGGAGVDRVEFGILRSADQRWWNGTAWVVDFVALPAFIGGNVWSRNSNLPSGANLRDGAYVIVGSAYDRVGNRRQQDASFIVDTTSPTTLTFTAPTAGARLSTLTPATGTVGDNEGGSGIQRVDLFIRRAADGKYWSGRNWSVNPIPLPTDLGSANTTWTRSGGPGGSNLLTGIYYLTAIAYDRTGNRISRTISVRVIDAIAPTITITAPAGGVLQGRFPTVQGTISDNPGGSGVARVALAIRRLSDNTYWNGSTWTQAVATIPGALTGTGGTWTVDRGFPTGANLQSGDYALIALGYDRAGNRSEARVVVPIIPDTTKPLITISSPREGSSIQSLVRVTGTVSDTGSGVDRVVVGLLRTEDQLFWNGQTWTDTFTPLRAVVTGNTWSLTTNLPPSSQTPRGFYVVIAQAFDRIGNLGQVDRNIAIDSNAPPQAASRTTDGLSTAAIAAGTVRLKWSLPLDGSAVTAGQFSIAVNGTPAEVEEVLYNASTQTLTLGISGGIASGASVAISWQDVNAANGSRLAGTRTVIAP